MKKTAFLSGITGQDGGWLAKILLEEGYEVYGGLRRNSIRDLGRLEFLGIKDKIKFVDFDLLDYSNIYSVVKQIKPTEFYNLAAQSFVGISFTQPISTYMMDGIAVGYILDILKTISPETKFYQASSSEMFGLIKDQKSVNEEGYFHPRSPYGVAKLFSHWATVNYRESWNMFCCSGILFNHESELRGPEFVTRKISLNAAKRYKGSKEVLKLGNLDSIRDWGHAKEYCRGMHLMMQNNNPDTFVLATGKAITVRKFAEEAFKIARMELAWEGNGIEEKGFNKKTGELLIEIDPQFFRPAEVGFLLGDASKAKKVLGWEPEIGVEKLAQIMVESDIEELM